MITREDPTGTGTIRRPTRSHSSCIEDMGRQCSPASLLARFQRPRFDIPGRYLASALRGSVDHHALTAEADGEVVALATACVVGLRVAQLGVLVRDDMQARGIGTQVTGELCALAARSGVVELTAVVGRTNVPARRLLDGLRKAGVTGPWEWQDVTSGYAVVADLLPPNPRPLATARLARRQARTTARRDRRGSPPPLTESAATAARPPANRR